MGALPSRESNEDPSTVFFANCGSHVVFHIPMTPHYFPSPDGLAFQQLLHARNNQSALYCFDVKDVASVLPQQAAEAFREAQDEDWGAEAEEPDPSVHYYDNEIREKIRECGGVVDDDDGVEPSVGRHFKHSIEDAASLYKVLVEEPTAGTLVDTDAEMCALFDAEQRWRAAVAEEFASAAKDRSDGHVGASVGPSTLPAPPEKFLYPLPHAIALRMTTEEEEEMRAEYCRLHKIPYVAPHFHDVKPGAAPPMMDAEAMERLGVPRTSSSTCFVACPMPLPLPLVERRRYHFEDDPKYRDGRVHLVEEHGVLYHFAYFPKKRRPAATTTAAAATAETTTKASPPTKTPIVLDRCLHDVVYSEEPDTSVSNNKQLAAAAAAANASTSSPFGSPSIYSGEPEVAPAKRYGRCARCGARIEQRMDYTQLRRLKATRVQRREARRAELEAALHAAQTTTTAAAAAATDDNSADAAAQREAWAAFAAAREAHKAESRGSHDDDGDEGPGSDNDLEVASHTERVEEEGEAEFIINIAPVRIGGMDGLLPSRTRGTPWLRGYEHEDEAAADHYVEQLPRKPPVMRTCRFVEGSVGDKIVNRAALVTMLSYRPMCRQAGLSNALTRPVWSTCVLSNIPYLQMVRETFFRAKAAVAEIDDNDLLLRNWLDVVDRENNFYNFINANLYMMRNFTPPERTVRQHELPEDLNSSTTVGQASSVAGGFGNGSVGTGQDYSAASSPQLGSPMGRGGSFDGDAQQQQPQLDRQQQQQQYNQVSSSSAASTSPLRTLEDQQGGERDRTARTSAHNDPRTPQQQQQQQQQYRVMKCADGDDDSASSVSSASSSTADAGPTAAQRPPSSNLHAPVSPSSHAHHTGVDSAAVAGAHTKDTVTSATTEAKAKHRTSGAELRSHHLTRDLEEATIGRPEGHGPRDAVETFQDNDDEDEDEEEEEDEESVGSHGNDAAARAIRRREEKRRAKQSKKGKSRKTVAGAVLPSSMAGAASMSLDGLSAGTGTSEATSWKPPVTAGVVMHPLATSDNKNENAADDDDGGEASGRPIPLPALTSPVHSSPHHQHSIGGEDVDDEDADLQMEEEEGHQRGRGTRTQEHGASSSTKGSTRRSTSAAEGNEDAQSQSLQPSRIEVPPRPNFQLFSSRLEPHAPVSLYSLFDYDGNTDVALTGGCDGVTGSSGGGGGAPNANTAVSGSADATTGAASALNASGDFMHGSTVLPSYVQHDILRENERRQAEPKSLRRPSHALYECGMLATTRGRSFLFLLREDCVHALLYYLSSAAAPIFIGAYIEPVDTTSVSYGGAVRLQKPDSVTLPLEGERGLGEEKAKGQGSLLSSERAATTTGATAAAPTQGADGTAAAKPSDDGGEQRQINDTAPATTATTDSTSRVIIGPVEGMEVMAEYYKSKGLITCFSVSDVERIAPGPSAAHRLRKMIVPPSPTHAMSNNGSYVFSEERALAMQQAREAGQLGHTYTYAAHEFRDGDLVVYNFDERRWEHYEHVQLRRRFASKAAAVAAAASSPLRGNNNSSSSPMGRSSAASSSLNSTTALGLMSSVVGWGGVGGGGGGSSSGRANDDVAVVVDGSIGNASSVGDASMSARLLCVGLDELLLSWTKWVVDNRFYEDRSDLGWLNLPDGSPIQLGGRYFLWSFRHNHQRYFYGVIPKFAKGRLRRQKLMERNRKKKKETEPSRGGGGGMSSSSASTKHKEGKLKGRSAGAKSKSRSPFTTQPSGRPHSTGSTGSHGSGRGRGSEGAYADPMQRHSGLSTLHGRSSSNQARMSSGAAACSSSSQQQQQQQCGQSALQVAHRDPLDCHASPPPQSSSAPRQQGLGNAFAHDTRQHHHAPCSNADGPEGSATCPTPNAHARTHSNNSPGVGMGSASIPSRSSPLTMAANSAMGSGFPGYGPAQQQQQQQQQQANAGYQPSATSNWPTSSATMLYGSSPGTGAAHCSSPLHQQQHAASSQLASANHPCNNNNNNSGCGSFPSVRVGNNVTRPGLSSSLTSLANPTAARRAPLLGPPPAQPRGASNNRATQRNAPLSSPGQVGAAAAAGATGGHNNYYHQYGGNTFIQDGKRHENEYYPPLPQHTPFHPASAAGKLIPLPHPQTDRGGIPAMFRYWGPVGHPSSRSGLTSSLLARPGMPLSPSSPQQQQQQQQQQLPLSPSASRVAFSSPMAVFNTSVGMMSNSSNGTQSLPVAGGAGATVVSVGGNPVPAATLSNVTVHVRRRGASATTGMTGRGGANPVSTAATTMLCGPAPPSGPSSLSASVSTMALGLNSGPAAMNSSFTTGPASFPATPVLRSEQHQQPHGFGVAAGQPAASATSLTGSATALPPSAAHLTSTALVGVGAAATGTSTTGSECASPPRRLSPTSMLPANLINEGSKTKGESVLRVEDTYVQRQAFRWNPYASTKWSSGSHEGEGVEE